MHDHWDTNSFFVEVGRIACVCLTVKTVLANQQTMISGINDQGIIQQTSTLQGIQQASDLLIDKCDSRQVLGELFYMIVRRGGMRTAVGKVGSGACPDNLRGCSSIARDQSFRQTRKWRMRFGKIQTDEKWFVGFRINETNRLLGQISRLYSGIAMFLAITGEADRTTVHVLIRPARLIRVIT